MTTSINWQPDGIFLLGGWGCPSHWLLPLRRDLAQSFECSVEMIDLPDDQESWQQNWLDQLAKYHRPLLIGWSYGGMLAVSLAHKLLATIETDCKVVTLGARPQFIDDDWTVFDAEVAESFRKRVAMSVVKGLSYFIALTAQGEPKAQIHTLKKDVQTENVSGDLLVRSLEHLYQLNVREAWKGLLDKDALFPVYFQHDALIRIPEHLKQDALDATHLAPVTNSSLVSSEIKRLFIG
ncbi:alpha/beta fold hydrolase [Litoribrevibacter euphylliae]|uniref:Alpha/beta fold hydrolase n=1 Tax=Litoribrevibacter euphylliae TaxID=1834034 RepID=A0ABV7HM22_9GAMM